MAGRKVGVKILGLNEIYGSNNVPTTGRGGGGGMCTQSIFSGHVIELDFMQPGIKY